MFEDALVESCGKLQSKSRYWMFATFAFNLIAVAIMALLPLLHPEALPTTTMTAVIAVPPPPPPAAAPPVHVRQVVRAVHPPNAFTAPTRIPARIDTGREPAPVVASAGIPGAPMSADDGSVRGVFDGIGSASAPAIVVREPEKPKRSGPLKISSGVAAGAILTRTTPIYPAIARAARVSGAVVLHAMISKAGSIESLQVISGPEMLRASALDAVRQWRYRPYLLNGEPTEVETTITVNFSFGA